MLFDTVWSRTGGPVLTQTCSLAHCALAVDTIGPGDQYCCMRIYTVLQLCATLDYFADVRNGEHLIRFLWPRASARRELQ